MAAMISDNDKRGEAQVLAAFDDFRDAVDSDNVILQVRRIHFE